MKNYCFIYAILTLLLLSSCGYKSSKSNSYRSSSEARLKGDSDSAIVNVNRQPKLADNQHADSGGYVVGNGNKIDEQSGEFIVGNGNSEGEVNGNSPLYLTMENYSNLDGIKDIYIVGESETSLEYRPSASGQSLVIMSESLKSRSEPFSLIIMTEDGMGAKVGPFALAQDGSTTEISVPIKPLQRVFGNINQGENHEVTLAGTKLSTRVNPDGSYAIGGVPVGAHQLVVSNSNNKAYLPAKVRESQDLEIQNMESSISISQLCAGLGQAEEISIDFRNQDISSYVQTSEDKAIDFKNKYKLASRSRFSVTDQQTKYLCDVEITLHPKNENYEYSNELAFMLNNNLLYTHIIEEDENKGILKGLNFFEIIGAVVNGVIQGIANIFKSILGIPEEIRPLRIGISDANDQSLIFNAFKSQEDMNFDILCLKPASECRDNIDHITAKLHIVKE